MCHFHAHESTQSILVGLLTMSNGSRNIILVTIDSLRADHCGFLGDDRGLTPTLDRIAAESVVFEKAISPGPQTFSAMPAIFTGHPREPGPRRGHTGENHWQRRVSAIWDHLDKFKPITEHLHNRGYHTAGFSPNPWTSQASGFDRGFDHFADFSGQKPDGLLRSLVHRMPGIDWTENKNIELALNLVTGSSFFTHWENYYEQIDVVRKELPEPYFLWVFLLDTHFPFLPNRKHREEQSLLGMYHTTLRSNRVMRGHSEEMDRGVRDSVLKSYRDSVRSVDAFFDAIYADTTGDDPVLVVHSDHGESFGDHGNYGHHHRNVYEENVHVPFIVHNVGETSRITDPISLSVLPDILSAIARSDSFDPSSVPETPAISLSECYRNRAIRNGRFKFVDHHGTESLFDLSSDRAEETNCITNFPTEAAQLRSTLDRFENHQQEINSVQTGIRTITSALKL